jgi:ribosome biogenesis GTPase A
MQEKQLIQWYPGHIAKAERDLKDQLKRVDVILEVLDARIPLASHHPEVNSWIGSKPRLLILNRMDMIPAQICREWKQWFQQQGENVYLTNAKDGKGVKGIKQAAQNVGYQVNKKRKEKGMLPRPVRAVVIGFPNVGKSALINRLLGRKAVRSERRAGVTRQLQWVRISDEIELLDAPGIIPNRLNNQVNAVKLAICEDIGQASYDNQGIAAKFIDLLVELDLSDILQTRYKLNPLEMTGEEYIYNLGQKIFQGDTEKATMRLLNDFRKGIMGNLPLEFPPINMAMG